MIDLTIYPENKMGPPEGSPNRWLLGRRSVLLRPFWPIRRVVATKSTTSSNHIYSTFIIYQLFSFVKREIVPKPLPVPPVIFHDGRNDRIFQPFIVILGCHPDHKMDVFPFQRDGFARYDRLFVDFILENEVRVFQYLSKIGVTEVKKFFSPPLDDVFFLILRQEDHSGPDIANSNGIFFNINTADRFHTIGPSFHN
ncbi:MAG: hypothetical protein K2P37_13975 [Oscillospiraceae bacterium]|nr:hypothetical protein [Oscillospiraceae bacterium]